MGYLCILSTEKLLNASFKPDNFADTTEIVMDIKTARNRVEDFDIFRLKINNNTKVVWLKTQNELLF